MRKERVTTNLGHKYTTQSISLHLREMLSERQVDRMDKRSQVKVKRLRRPQKPDSCLINVTRPLHTTLIVPVCPLAH